MSLGLSLHRRSFLGRCLHTCSSITRKQFQESDAIISVNQRKSRDHISCPAANTHPNYRRAVGRPCCTTPECLPAKHLAVSPSTLSPMHVTIHSTPSVACMHTHPLHSSTSASHLNPSAAQSGVCRRLPPAQILPPQPLLRPLCCRPLCPRQWRQPAAACPGAVAAPAGRGHGGRV